MSKLPEKYFSQFPHVLVVNGKSAAAVYDFKHNSCHRIPLILKELMEDLAMHPVSILDYKYGFESRNLIDKYLEFLLKRNWGFVGSCRQNFKPLDLSWHCPHHIQNAIIEWGDNAYDFKILSDRLDELLCRHIELRAIVEEKNKFKRLLKDISHLNGKCFRTVDLHLDCGPGGIHPDAVQNIYDSSTKIDNIVLYNQHEYLSNHPQVSTAGCPLSEKAKEANSINTFTGRYIVNLLFFTEALHFNTYYNRKLCIDRLGNVKNCPKSKNIFGNINKAGWMKVIDSREFKTLWYASVDKIIDVRDFELRYAMLLTQPIESIGNDKFRIIGHEIKK